MELAWKTRRGVSWYATSCLLCKRLDISEEYHVGALVLGLYVRHTCSTLEKRRRVYLEYLEPYGEAVPNRIFMMRFESSLGFFDRPRVS